jgi:amino acid transporter
VTAATTSGYQFGTFKGVFTPSILTILGVVMYLRLGWVLGNVGLPTTIVIVTLATAITFLTGLSLSALATNMRVGGGGAYFIISRALGVEAGAAIGLPLYLAQALGISFYIAGFAESVVATFPQLDQQTVGLGTLLLLTLLVFFSADLALKSQFLIMAAIAASLVSFFLGTPAELTLPPDAEIPERLPFWVVFAVFFPAVTGIEAGIAMSGDLKSPARSLPLGTLLAVLTGFAVYLSIPILLSKLVSDHRVLLADPLVMQKVARWGSAVLVGVWAASLSSAMGALLGAPRTLQALARDGVVPRSLGRGFGPGNDPRFATAVSFAIGLAGVLLGDLNLIAPILSMFFLTSYGILNLSAGMEELILNPAWRPKFRVPAAVALGGFFACAGVMLMIDAGSTIMAAVVCGGIYSAMKRRSLRARWGDLRLGMLMFGARQILQRMQGRQLDERSWKPNLLVLSGSPATRWYLVELADAIAQGRSFVTVATILPEEGYSTERAAKLTASIREYLRSRDVPAFIRVFPAPDPYTGAAELVRSYGFGPIVPNTVLIGETERPASFVKFAGLVQLVTRRNRNLVIVREEVEKDSAGVPRPRPPRRRIDVWWASRSPNMGFLLALSFLLQRSEEWHSAELSIRTVVDAPDQEAAALGRLTSFLGEARVVATPGVAVAEPGRAFEEIARVSAEADLVFLGMRPTEDGETAEEYSRYYEDLLHRTATLPATALVVAGEKTVDFKAIFRGH